MSDEEGLGGIISWLDVCRVVLLKVEQAACKKLRQVGSTQAAQSQPISYIIIAAGPSAELYHSWSYSWRVKHWQGNRIASEDVHAILRTEEFEEHQ